MIQIGDKEYRNLMEQVGKNMHDIEAIKQALGNALPDPIPGPDGPQGVGVSGAAVEAGNRLYITLTNGQRIFAGVIHAERGERGLKGEDGAMGVSGAKSIIGIDAAKDDPTVSPEIEDDEQITLETVADILAEDVTKSINFKLRYPIKKAVFSRKNIILNSNFKFNSRGGSYYFTSSGDKIKTLDCWNLEEAGAEVEARSNGVYITWLGQVHDYGMACFWQKIGTADEWYRKYIALSIKTEEGTYQSNDYINGNESVYSKIEGDWFFAQIESYLENDVVCLRVSFWLKNDVVQYGIPGLLVNWIKLEAVDRDYGQIYSTPYEAPDESIEQIRLKRYIKLIELSNALSIDNGSGTLAYIDIPLDVPMAPDAAIENSDYSNPEVNLYKLDNMQNYCSAAVTIYSQKQTRITLKLTYNGGHTYADYAALLANTYPKIIITSDKG